MTAPSASRRFLLLAVVALLLGTGYALLLRRMHPGDAGQPVLAAAADSPESFSDVADFALVESSGRAVTRADLLGKPWIAGFVFTRCTGPCPRITANMRRMMDLLEGVDARLVTISVDPEYDTPAVLAEYAKTVGADTSRWWFLTGPLADVVNLSEKSFLLPIQRDDSQPVGSSVTHRTWLTVVDAQGKIRGYYNGENEQGIERAVARARYLASSR